VINHSAKIYEYYNRKVCYFVDLKMKYPFLFSEKKRYFMPCSFFLPSFGGVGGGL